GDRAGVSLARGIASLGFDDLSAVFMDRATPVADEDEEIPLGKAAGIYAAAFDKQLRRHPFRDAMAEATALVIDTSLSAAAISRAIEASKVPVAALACGLGDTARLLPFLPRLHAVALGEMELRAMLSL